MGIGIAILCGDIPLDVRLTLTAGMLIDQLPKQEQAKVARVIDKLRASSPWDDLQADPIRRLAGGNSGQRTFSYSVGDDLRVIFTVVGNTVHVLDVVRPEQVRNLRADRRASG
jgi:hypothetical protein